MSEATTTTTTTTRVRPFRNGVPHLRWVNSNCFPCRISTHCEINKALIDMCFDDGTVSQEIADRMGYTAHQGEYTWDCPERVDMWTKGEVEG